METQCRCGDTCIQPASTVLKDIESFYKACDLCKTWNLKKFSPLARQIDIDKINTTFGLCGCGRRHLDIVIAHVLKIMIDEGIKDERSTLRDTCVPIVTPAYPLNSVPYLPENSMVILSNEMNEKCAKRVVNEVREVKGVIKGNIMETAGIKDSDLSPNVYELLAGCDMRCDIVQTPYGTLCIHKDQGKIHIEFPQVKSPKIEILQNALEKYDAPSVLDCTCGPGTLGITCLKAGAREVVFNDIWSPAVAMTAINLETNGFPVEKWNPDEEVIAEGEKFKVFSLDIRQLKDVLDEKFDICIIDVFPGVDTADFVEAAGRLGKEVVVI